MILLYAGLAATGGAQNLVPNGSFEEYDECPDLWYQIERAIGWTSYRGSPDYFNSCDSTGVVSVPLSFVGNGNAASGEAYAGVIAWSAALDEREYLGVELNTPLVPNVPVFLSFKVMMATGGTQQDCRWSTNGIGMSFTMDSYSALSYMHIPNRAVIHLDMAPIANAGWTMVSGVYVPDSAYRYLALGGLFSDTLIEPILFNPGGNYNAAFALIDDVCVSYNPNDCAIRTDLLDRTVARLHAFPNPFTTEVHVMVDGPICSSTDICLRDSLGRIVWTGRLEPGQSSFSIEAGHLPDGCYIISESNMVGEFAPTVVVRASN